MSRLCPAGFTLALHLCAAAALSFALLACAQTNRPGLRLDWLLYCAAAAGLSWVLHALSEEESPPLKSPPLALLYGSGLVIIALVRTLKLYGSARGVDSALIGQAIAQLILLYSLGSWRKLNPEDGTPRAPPTPVSATAVLISGLSSVLAAWRCSAEGALPMAVFGLWCVIFALTAALVAHPEPRRARVTPPRPAGAHPAAWAEEPAPAAPTTPPAREAPERQVAARFVTTPRPPPSDTVLRGASFAREPTVVLRSPSEGRAVLARLRARTPSPPPPPQPSPETLALARAWPPEENASFSLPMLEAVDAPAPPSVTEPFDHGPVIPTEWDPVGLAPTRRGPRPKAALFAP